MGMPDPTIGYYKYEVRKNGENRANIYRSHYDTNYVLKEEPGFWLDVVIIGQKVYFTSAGGEVIYPCYTIYDFSLLHGMEYNPFCFEEFAIPSIVAIDSIEIASELFKRYQFLGPGAYQDI